MPPLISSYVANPPSWQTVWTLHPSYVANPPSVSRLVRNGSVPQMRPPAHCPYQQVKSRQSKFLKGGIERVVSFVKLKWPHQKNWVLWTCRPLEQHRKSNILDPSAASQELQHRTSSILTAQARPFGNPSITASRSRRRCAWLENCARKIISIFDEFIIETSRRKHHTNHVKVVEHYPCNLECFESSACMLTYAGVYGRVLTSFDNSLECLAST